MTGRGSSSLLLPAWVVAIALVQFGCAAELKIPETVNVQVPVPCVKPEDVPARPAVRSEDDLMAMDRWRRTLAAWSDLKKLEAWSAELEAIAQGCSKIPPAKPRL